MTIFYVTLGSTPRQFGKIWKGRKKKTKCVYGSDKFLFIFKALIYVLIESPVNKNELEYMKNVRKYIKGSFKKKGFFSLLFFSVSKSDVFESLISSSC